MIATILDRKGQGNSAIYARLRDDSLNYFDFYARTWVGVETAQCRIYLVEYPDASQYENRYQASYSPPFDIEFICEVVRVSDMLVLGEDPAQTVPSVVSTSALPAPGPIRTFAIPPNSSGYSATDGIEVLSVQLAGGLSKYRRDQLDAAAIVDVSWVFNPAEYDYFRAFYHLIGNGSDSFLIALLLDSSTVQTYEAHFVPGSLKLPTQTGLAYTVQAQLEVLPPVIDLNAAEATVTAYEQSIHLGG